MLICTNSPTGFELEFYLTSTNFFLRVPWIGEMFNGGATGLGFVFTPWREVVRLEETRKARTVE